MADKEIIGKTTKAPVEFYRVGEPAEGGCMDGCCIPVFTRDMEQNGEASPLFFVEAEFKTELAAKLLGVSTAEIDICMKLIEHLVALTAEYKKIKEQDAKVVGYITKEVAEEMTNDELEEWESKQW